jgi:hypothetical protein
MSFDPQIIIELLSVVAFFAFVILWSKRAHPRLRVWIREKPGQIWDVTINERIQYRNLTWEISGPHTRGQSILANIVLFITDFGCLAGPIFGALLLMGLLMFALSGE